MIHLHQKNGIRGAFALVAVLSLLTTGFAMAQPAAGHGPGIHALKAALSTLDLTDKQKGEIKALLESKKDGAAALRDKAKADRQALHALLESPNPDPTAVGAAFLKVHANRQAARAAFKDVRDGMASILTPEQLAKLKGYFAAVRHGRAMRRMGPPPAEQ